MVSRRSTSKPDKGARTVHESAVRRVVILGGGTAGWMSAAYLAKALAGTAEITVLEAPTIPRIGVGEATIPNLQTAFFDFLGIPESEWMPECNASYKMAVKFINWRTPGTPSPHPKEIDGVADQFYHVFGQLPTHEGLPLSHYWVNDRLSGATDEPFDYACYRETPIMDAMKGPMTYDGTRVANHAWHFDAQLVADFLCRHSTKKLDVRHIQDEMTTVDIDDRGYLTALHTKSGARLEADLFVDCSGFRGLLINKALEEPFVDMSDHLLNNSAVATQIPHADEDGVEPYTSSIAMNAGWTWKIPLLGRFGSGYVYSSTYIDKDEAAREFCALWQLDPDSVPLNHIRFRVGRNRRAWVNNCVSIGTSSCFVEPLESTGIYFIYAALNQLVKHFPDTTFNPVLRDSFNREIEKMFDDTRDFIQAHFYFSPRTDTPFWRDNKELTLGPDIQEKAAMYRAGLAINQTLSEDEEYYSNFEEEFHNFWTNSNYYCVFAGLGYLPERPLPRLAHMPAARQSVSEVFAAVKRGQQELLASVPTTKDLLRHQYR
jgi:tryptophan 6-halogenase